MAALEPLRNPRFLEGVRAPIFAAVVLAFVADLALQPPAHLVEVVARAIGFGIVAGVQVLFGMFLGTRAWPKRGLRLARILVKRAVRAENRPLIFLTDRPDATAHLGRRLLEVVGFAAGASVVLAAILPFLGVGGINVFALAATLTLLTLWGCFLLVPYWLFARMGLRQVDAVRWIVEPVSRRYADRMKLSNGALLLVALGASVNLAFRAGQSGEQALIEGVRSLVTLVASIFLVAASAAAFYTRKEKVLAKEFEEEVLAYGIKDGRGMTDGQFLPKLP